MIPFHITDIHLDYDLDVSGVTALMDEHDLPALNQLIYPAGATDQELLEIADRVRVARREPDGTELLVHLDLRELMRLYRRVNRNDTPELPGAWHSLYRVVTNLIEPDEFPAETWDEHQRPTGGIWRGYLDQDVAPELLGMPCRMDPDGDQGAVKVTFYTGTALHLDKDTRFRVMRTSRPATRDLRTEPEAVTALQDLVRGMVLAAGADNADPKTIADTVAAHITDHFSPYWERAVNHDDDVSETRGRIPDDPNRYVRRLAAWGTTYSEDPTGQWYHDTLFSQAKQSGAWSRMREAASRRIGPGKDAARIPVRVGLVNDGLVLFNVGSHTVASATYNPGGGVQETIDAVTAVVNAYHISVVVEATGEPVPTPEPALPAVRETVERIVRQAGPDGITWADLHTALATGGPWGPAMPVSKVSLSKLLKKPGTAVPVAWLAPRGNTGKYVHAGALTPPTMEQISARWETATEKPLR